MNSPLLSLDLGLKRTGIAISENGLIAKPLTVVKNEPPHFHRAIQEIVKIIQTNEIQTLIIGIPYGENEEDTTQSIKYQHLSTLIIEGLKQKQLTPEVDFLNECHTSQDAQLLFPDIPVDAAAATIILQDYIDQNT
jgi:RNase H-fold protein (predicted Holliday junction resolvase)